MKYSLFRYLYMEHLINSNEIKSLLGDKFPILKTKMLEAFYKAGALKSFYELFEMLNQDAIIILYENQPNQGHWTAVLKTKCKDDKSGLMVDCIEFFDSYNKKPDEQNKYIPPQFHDDDVVTKMMINTPGIITYNHYKFQKMKEGISTCGRHVLLRILMRKKTLDEYNHMIKSLMKESGKDADEVVTDITEELLGRKRLK